MKYLSIDLKQQKQGAIVRVHLKGNAANVQLLDSSNFSAYRAGRRHTYRGGHYRKSPVDLQIPHSGHWHVVVDLGGYPGRIGASAEILPGPLPPGRSLAPGLATIADNLTFNGDVEFEKEFDVFISHASEDKDAVVRSLAQSVGERARPQRLVRRVRAARWRQLRAQDFVNEGVRGALSKASAWSTRRRSPNAIAY